ncbi:MAG: hypothetical protein AB8B57_10885 [Congregibacter sp.]
MPSQQRCRALWRVAFIASFLFLFTACTQRVELGPGELASEPPLQSKTERRTLDVLGNQLHTRAEFSVTGKILSKRRYRWDRLTPLVPWDFAMGWGVLSDEAHLQHTRVTQGDRFMFWHLYDSPLSLPLVERSSANMHLIPANEAVLKIMQSVPRGAIVTITGQLVDVTLQNGKRIPTSLSRRDTGPGACEIVYVENLRVVHDVPGSVDV